MPDKHPTPSDRSAARAPSQKSAIRVRRKLALLWRLSGLISLLLFLAVLIPAVLTTRATDRLLRQKLTDRGATLAATVSSATSNLVANEDTTSLQTVIFALVQGDSSIAGARVCDKTGTIVCYSRDEERGTAVAGLLNPPSQLESREISRPNGPRLLQVSTPLFKHGEPWGTLQFELSFSQLDDEISATMERSFWIGLVVLALGTAFAAWVARAITRPIAKLAAAATEVAKGNLAARTGLSSSDEIGELAKTFDRMTSELAKTTYDLRARSSSLELQVTRRKQALEAKNVELEEVKKEAEKANRSRSEFLDTLSQEMRAPVDQIVGMADVALDTHLSAEQRQYVTFAKEYALGLRAILRDSSDFLTRLEAGKADSVFIGFQLREVVGDILSLFASKAHAKGIELIGQIATDAPDALVGNPDRVRQVLLNLVGNAVKFTARGEVILRVEKEKLANDEVVLHFIVKDTGPGIAPEKQPAVRDALLSTADSDVRSSAGAMLGLAISAQLAGTLGGKIWFESAPGSGCTFHFQAACRLQPGVANGPTDAETARFAGLRAVVVTSNDSLRGAIEERLAGWGMDVECAAGSTAVATLDEARKRGRSTDVLVLDAAVAAAEHHTLWKAAEAAPGIFGSLVLLDSDDEHGNEAAWWSSVARIAFVTKPVKESDLARAILEGTRAPGETVAR